MVSRRLPPAALTSREEPHASDVSKIFLDKTSAPVTAQLACTVTPPLRATGYLAKQRKQSPPRSAAPPLRSDGSARNIRRDPVRREISIARETRPQHEGVYPPDAIFLFASRRYIPCLSITRGGTDKGKRSGRVDAERGKRTWKWEGGRDSGLPPRTRVGGSAKNAVVEHVEMCTALDAWMSRAVASTRLLLPVSTFHYDESLLGRGRCPSSTH